MIIAQGGRFGGWTLYAKDGQAKFVYNMLGIHEFATAADSPIPAGTHQVRMEFAYDGGGLAKGGDVTLYYDGKPVGTGRVENTQPMIFSADETTDIGYESGTTVTPDYTAQDSRFTGKIKLGADRPRHRRPRPLHRPRGTPPHRHGQAVAVATEEGRARSEELEMAKWVSRPHSAARLRSRSIRWIEATVKWALAIVALALLGVAAISRRLSGTPVTPAMVFVAVGLLVGPQVLDGIDLESSSGDRPHAGRGDARARALLRRLAHRSRAAAP